MFKVEKMTVEGWERFREVRLRALLDTPDAFGRLHGEEADWEPALWHGRLADRDSDTFIAVQDRVDVGLVTVANYSGKTGAAGLFGMWAAPDARGTGAATGLVQAGIAWAQVRGFERVLLDVADENPRAIAFYQRLGFLPTGLTGTLPEPRQHVTEHERELLF
jgi:ribosomal protein S18 acetylase RimI-like enzyme